MSENALNMQLCCKKDIEGMHGYVFFYLGV